MRITIKALPILSALLVMLGAGAASADNTRARLTVMTFNIYSGGAAQGKPVDDTVAAIVAAGADIIGVQETRLEGKICTANYCPARGKSVARAIAEELGYYYYDQRKENDALWANAVISRFPIVSVTPNDLGVVINVDGSPVYAFNIHLDNSPYQPYQLLGIPYGKWPFIKTEKEAIYYARMTRGPAVRLLKKDLATVRDAAAVFIFGDFNEPSFHDWTKAAVKAGNQPIRVRWPTTRAIEKLGFTDALRAIYPDPVAKPAFTWTPTTDPSDPDDHHDRIDFVFARGKNLVVKSAAVVGEKKPEADIVVDPWPSDHRAIAATVQFDLCRPGRGISPETSAQCGGN